MERCPFCRIGVLVPLPASEYAVELAGRRFEFELPGLVCGRCLRGSHDKAAAARADVEVAMAFARAAVVHPDVFRFQRKVLGFTSSEAAELLNVTLNTLSRWENNERPLDRNAALLLASMVLDEASHPPKQQTLEMLKRSQSKPEVTMRGDPYLFSLNPAQGELLVEPGRQPFLGQEATQALELVNLVLDGELEHFLVVGIEVAGVSVLSAPVRATVLGPNKNIFSLEGRRLEIGNAVRVQVENTSNEPRKISGQCLSYAQRSDVGSKR